MTHVMASVKAVAAVTGRSERTIRRWVAEGVLEACEGRDGSTLVWAQQAIRIERERRTRNRARPPRVWFEDMGGSLPEGELEDGHALAPE